MKTEFEFINALRAKSKVQSPKSKVKIGIGDDCAVISQDSKTDLVITTDLLVEDIDFRRDWTTPELIGQKALAVSLSDIAAMGAKPIWALVSIAIWHGSFVDEFYQGWFIDAGKFEVKLAGGDISRTSDKIVIDSIVAGEVKKNRAILRSCANVGDLIFVTGSLGGAAAGLNLLQNGVRYDSARMWQRKLISRQLNPFPQLSTSRKLSEQKLATSMIDISDGLSSDLTHICQASDVGARIYADKIPLQKKIQLVENLNPLFSALNGGEDYELLFTVNPKNKKKLEKHFSEVSFIGEIVEQNQGITLIGNGQATPLFAEGFRHF
jgi:thiamine-monophosphate kinase